MPIGCGGVPVFPEDIVVGDDEGVVIVPACIADEIAEEATRMTLFDDVVAEVVMSGRSITGLYPPTDPRALADFEAWKAARGIRS